MRAAAASVIAAAGLVLAASPTSAEVSLPSFPPIPPIHVHLPKPQESAAFNVVVEGSARSTLRGDTTGNTGGCIFTVQGAVKDVSRYLRGKGAHVEFDRYGSEVLVHRVGRETDASLAVVVAQVRTAEGSVFLESAGIPELPCTAHTRALSSSSDCGQTFNHPGAAALEYEANSLRLNISSKEQHSLASDFDDCGSDEITGQMTSFAKAWPTPPRLEFGHLTLGQIFGHAHALAIKLRSSDVGHEEEESKTPPPPFTGTLTEKAFNEATVRLVRLPHG
jgi:hypothetical protein